MGSRIRNRKSVKRMFECYMIVEPPWSCSATSPQTNGTSSTSNNHSPLHRTPSEALSTSPSGTLPPPSIRSVYPSTYSKPDVLKTAAQFAFPCPSVSETVELFTFVLTSEDSKWTFGYCRHPHGSKNCVLFLTFLPWQEIFYRALNYLAEVPDPSTFLERMYSTSIPEPGTCLYIPTPAKPFICPCPSDLSLPSIPENRNVSEFYNALTTESMLTLFAALLAERRVVITSKKISRLSSLCVASNLFLFPMAWQHIFIPVLSLQLHDYLSAPMPFLIGVPLPVWDRIPAESLGQVVRVDADSDTVTTPFPEDLEEMPEDVVYLLRKNLTGERVLGDGLARAFLRALAQLMGHYHDAVRNEGESFDPDLFVQFAHPTHREFIQKKLLKLQIFQQFMDERLEKIKSGNNESDEFELESLAWRSSRANGRNGLRVLGGFGRNQNKVKKAGKAVIRSVKREGESIIESVKQISALQSAVRSLKEGGKNVKHKGHVAYSDIRSKFHVSHHHPSRAIEYGVAGGGSSSSSSKTYRRQATSVVTPSSNHHLHPKDALESKMSSSTSHHHYLRASDDNLMSSSMSASLSASKMNEIILASGAGSDGVDGGNGHGGHHHHRVTPRLSKSEENLIDLDTPTGLGCFDLELEDDFFYGEGDEYEGEGGEVGGGEGLGYTLENPLYDLLTDNNNVFLEDKTDAELLSEYGLSHYFDQMNFSGGGGSGGGGSGGGGSGGGGSGGGGSGGVIGGIIKTTASGGMGGSIPPPPSNNHHQLNDPFNNSGNSSIVTTASSTGSGGGTSSTLSAKNNSNNFDPFGTAVLPSTNSNFSMPFSNGGSSIATSTTPTKGGGVGGIGGASTSTSAGNANNSVNFGASWATFD